MTLAVVMRQAGREVEVGVRGDDAHGTRRHTQFALATWVVIDGKIVCGRLRLHQDRPEQDEVAELRVDDIAVNAHVARPAATATGVHRDPEVPPGNWSISMGSPSQGSLPARPGATPGPPRSAPPHLVDLLPGVVELEMAADRAGLRIGSRVIGTTKLSSVLVQG